jgi:hypothetical protein
LQPAKKNVSRHGRSLKIYSNATFELPAGSSVAQPFLAVRGVARATIQTPVGFPSMSSSANKSLSALPS